jgi:peptidoglycan/xylan/chitin deacetylase (PgdA/CDA1 family)
MSAFMLASCSASAQTPQAIVTFTFDDVPKSVARVGLPILQKYRYPATVFVETRNTDGNYPDYMNWDDVKKVADAGWEVGAHTHTHPHLTKLTDEEILEDLFTSAQKLAEHGYAPTDFASPYGDLDDRVLAIIKRHYASQRDAWPAGVNELPLKDPYHIASYEVNNDTNWSTLSSLLDDLQTKGGWLVLQVHEVTPKGQPVQGQYDTNLLEDIVERVHARGFPVLTIREALSRLSKGE